MKKLLTIFLSTLLLACSIPSARAATTPTPQQTPHAPTGLGLEITYYKDRPPAYQAVRAAGDKPAGSWFGLFGRVPTPQPAAPDSLPVRAVNILSRVEGDAVRIYVSVFTGVKFHDKEEPVASYLVREGERVSVRELTQFGVEPFEIKVVRINPLSANPPPVTNKTLSLAVIGVEVRNSTFPFYRLSLQNVSTKNVAGLAMEVHVNGKRQMSAKPRREDGRTLIAAGEVYQHDVWAVERAQAKPDGYSPSLPSGQEIVIAGALFEDGSYEGEAETIAAVAAFRIGEKKQITKALEIFRQALLRSADAGDPAAAAAQTFKAQLSALSNDADAAVMDELLRGFPTLDRDASARLKFGVAASLHRVKKDLLKSLQEFEKNNGTPVAGAFRAWLVANQEVYETWLSRL